MSASDDNTAHRPRVLLDVDGVLADFVSGYLEIVRHITGRDYKPEQVTQFDIELSLGLTPDEGRACKRMLGESRGFCESLDVYPESQEGVDALQMVADVYIVTAPWNSCATWTHEREAWLKKHFGIRPDHVIHTSAKYVCAGDFLVDDKVSACLKWQREHPSSLAVIWDTPHNRLGGYDGGVRTRDWSALRRIVRQLSSGPSDDRSAAAPPAAGRSSDGGTATPAAARGAGTFCDEVEQ